MFNVGSVVKLKDEFKPVLDWWQYRHDEYEVLGVDENLLTRLKLKVIRSNFDFKLDQKWVELVNPPCVPYEEML